MEPVSGKSRITDPQPYEQRSELGETALDVFECLAVPVLGCVFILGAILIYASCGFLVGTVLVVVFYAFTRVLLFWLILAALAMVDWCGRVLGRVFRSRRQSCPGHAGR